MTTLTDTQVITASGGLVELGYSQITSAVSVTGSDIAVIGDLTVVCDGSPVAIEFYSPRLDLAGTTLGDGCEIYLWVDGVKTGRIAERYHPNAATGPYTTTYGVRRLTPSAGSHTFKITATRQGATSPSISAGAGTTTTQSPAFLRVSKIVQATQWPAVTTGTIICTSSTRPSAPFEGQEIYETDTKRTLTYNGSGWYRFNQIIARATSTSTYTSTGTHTSAQDVGLSTSVTYAANRLFRVTLHERPYTPGGANTVMERLTDGSTVFALFPHGQSDLSTGFAPAKTNVFTFAGPSTSGTATWKMQAYGGLNTQWVLYYSGGDGNPRQFTIEDVGPA